MSGIWCTGNKRLVIIKIAAKDCHGKPMKGSPFNHAPLTANAAPLAGLQRRVYHRIPPFDPIHTFAKGEGIVEIGSRLCLETDSKGGACQLRIRTNRNKSFFCGSAQNADEETVWRRASFTKHVLRHFFDFVTSGSKSGHTTTHSYRAWSMQEEICVDTVHP